MNDDIQEPQVEQDQVDTDQVDDDTPDEPQEPAPKPEGPQKDWTDEDEQDARLFGWKPPEEWQGEKPVGYIDKPTDFLARVQRSKIFQTMQQKLQGVDEIARKQEAMNQKALEIQREQYQSQMKALTEQQRQAVNEADGERYDALEAQRQKLAESDPRIAKPEAQETQRQADPEIEQYRSSPDGSWMNDPFLIRAGADVINKTPGAIYLSGKEQAELARRELSKVYPDRFPQATPRPAPRNTVDGGGLAGGGARQGGAFAKLPADAKSQFSRFVKEGLFKDTPADKEEFANDFNAA